MILMSFYLCILGGSSGVGKQIALHFAYVQFRYYAFQHWKVLSPRHSSVRVFG
jgi:hypothetical protein